MDQPSLTQGGLVSLQLVCVWVRECECVKPLLLVTQCGWKCCHIIACQTCVLSVFRCFACTGLVWLCCYMIGFCFLLCGGRLCSLEYDAHALVLSAVSGLVVVVFELTCLADGGSVTSEPESWCSPPHPVRVVHFAVSVQLFGGPLPLISWPSTHPPLPQSAQQLPSVELIELSLEDTICIALPLLGDLHSRLPSGCRQESLKFPSVLLLFCFLRKTAQVEKPVWKLFNWHQPECFTAWSTNPFKDVVSLFLVRQ